MKKEFILIFFILVVINISWISVVSAADKKISIELNWDDSEIINGQEFDIQVSASNLDDKDYDVKVFIYGEDNKIMSQTYNIDKWATSNNYVKQLFKGPEDEQKQVKLRINSNYKDFKGDAKIGCRIRVSGSSSYQEIKKDISILEGESKQENNGDANEDKTVIEEKQDIKTETIDKSVKQAPAVQTSFISEEVIKLGSNKAETEDIKTQNNIVYESKNELIKKYSIYGFAFLCVILIILLVLIKI
jgi:hypothetical protein